MAEIPIIFDLDGTLLDLPVEIAGAKEAIAALFREEGFEGSLRPILAGIRRAAEVCAPEREEAARLEARAREILDAAEVAAARQARARPGAGAATSALLAGGRRVAVVTDQGRACVRPALEAAGLAELAARAVAIVTRDDVARPKPAPDGILSAAAALRLGDRCRTGGASGKSLPRGVPGGAAVLVGDSERDILAARAAAPLLPGVRLFSLGVLGGQSAAASLEAAGADRVLEALDELPRWLAGSGAR